MGLMPYLTIYVFLLCARGTISAAQTTLKDVVTVAINVESWGFGCLDWYQGTANSEYLAALSMYKLGVTPTVSCRQVAQTVRSVDLVSEQGADLLGGDPRKASEGVAELREVRTSDRVSLNVNFFYTVSTPAEAHGAFVVLDGSIRSGDFMAKVSSASTPLLKAEAYLEMFG